MIKLPDTFIKKYRQLMGDEADDFLAALQGDSYSGFRINPLKNGRPTQTLEKAAGPVPGVATGFYGSVDGKSLDHVTGWVYSQEPSAMQVGEVVDPQPGEKVLDLCAAPGGKSTHLIGKMHDQGLLVANEIFTKRARVLASNLERWGTANTVVANEEPQKLVPKFAGFFDRILVDAPCSGEGMFRKDPQAISYWNPDYPSECANRQRKILASAMQMLKPGGVLVYSTCTFAPEEDEQNMAWLLKEYPDLRMLPIPLVDGMDHARPEWADNNPELAKAVRLFPHHFKGEGHFIAKLQLSTAAATTRPKRKKKKRRGQEPWQVSRDEQQLFKQWQTKNVPDFAERRLVKFGDQLYALPDQMIDLSGLDLISPGLHLGTFKKKRFEPALAWALTLTSSEVKRQIELTPDQWRQYVHGDVVNVSDSFAGNGWYLLTCEGHSCGWGKLVNHTIKNFFPKGLRF
ncbi:fmu domain-containing protein [Limosilactobacillus secaliphilus]|uniref:Fmu domain-containing protein n=1 Tax=Limosilactobacillus secaliphilus TaxID=396268 RepID=A0A0R2IAU0_9LACO|nr:fmu domain-containing protein [Limosilactobacillus secaliphilus]